MSARADAPASSPPAVSSLTRENQSATSGDTERLIASFRAHIRAAQSATRALEARYAERYVAADSRLVALRLPVPDKPLSPAQRLRLAIGPDEPVRYRRVRPACDGRALSEADDRYVPGRLTPAMNAALDTMRTPFGRAVQSLDPVRRTLDQRVLSSRARPDADKPLFAVDALLATGSGGPFCTVAETYHGGALLAVVR